MTHNHDTLRETVKFEIDSIHTCAENEEPCSIEQHTDVIMELIAKHSCPNNKDDLKKHIHTQGNICKGCGKVVEE